LLAAVAGGLHTHVAHHLFPGICHVHYPALTRLIATTARDCGLPYRVNPHFGAALAAHHRLLHRLV
jgi:linoleoyl-CoA desaturase